MNLIYKKNMKNKIIFTIILVAFISFIYSPVLADTAIHLEIKTPTYSLYSKDITVVPCNSDNNTTSTLKATAYCAILQSGIQNDWNWDWYPGAFLKSLGNITGFTSKDNDNNDVYHYWNWSLNETDGTIGLNQYELQPHDIISLYFIDPGNLLSLSIQNSPSGGGPILSEKQSTTIKPIFDLKKALTFLRSQQKENGSFGEDLYTDWTALSLASSPDNQDQKNKLIKYYSENKPVSQTLTDYERRAMALMALNLNPYNINNENYIQKIIDTFDSKQFGDINQDNDDIFALIVLQNAGYVEKDKMITEDINFILSKQKKDGSWDESVDMTGASIEALALFNNTDQIKDSLIKAKDFFKRNQKETGGWNNVSSTAWALEGILALNEKPENWIKNGNSPLDYLALNQDTDGGIIEKDLNTKIWETAYVASAMSLRSWNQIMSKFETPSLASDGVKTLLTTSTTPSIINKIAKNKAKRDTIEIVKNKKNNLTRTNSQNITNIIDTKKDNDQAVPSENSKKQNWFSIIFNKIFGL